MNKVNISFMTEEAVETLRKNAKKVWKKMTENKEDSNWLIEIYSGNIFEEKKYKIPQIELNISENDNYEEVDYENSIKIYEGLKDLPRYIICDERFWCWFNFRVAYKAALQAIPLKSETTFLNMWLFENGNRRGLTFNVMARCYLRVDMSVDNTLSDKYELTKFVIENPIRFRNLTWRAFSNNKKIVLGTLKAEKALVEKYNKEFSSSQYEDIAKRISLYASTKIIDVISEEEIYNFVYQTMEKLYIKE